MLFKLFWGVSLVVQKEYFRKLDGQGNGQRPVAMVLPHVVAPVPAPEVKRLFLPPLSIADAFLNCDWPGNYIKSNSLGFGYFVARVSVSRSVRGRSSWCYTQNI